MIISYPRDPTDRDLVSLGRNGTMFTRGLSIEHYGICISLQPVTSKGIPGRCRIELPSDPTTLTQIANHLIHIAHQIQLST